ncbi:hypothetical protein ACJ6WF_18750 [Streptomyces sp. MMS24-I2-30]|uniref:hypothetical protein n=1 Tax=Streptomyces sp. MMS24-I2-30 TaxID=3351564 RepID=UPI0038968461
MTPSAAEHPQTPIDDFEELADAAPAGVRLEPIDGRVHTKAPLSVEAGPGRPGDSRVAT